MLELKDYVHQPCKSRLACEFVPKKKHELGLDKIAQTLKSDGVMIETQVPFLLIFKLDGLGVSLFRSGKIIVKDTNDMVTAKQIVQKLIEKIGKIK